MAELQLEVDDWELQRIDEDLRKPFPEHGTKCNIENCQTDVFTNYPKYIKHWKKIHVEKVTIHYCSKCKASFRDNTSLKRHYISKHKINRENV